MPVKYEITEKARLYLRCGAGGKRVSCVRNRKAVEPKSLAYRVERAALNSQGAWVHREGRPLGNAGLTHARSSLHALNAFPLGHGRRVLPQCHHKRHDRQRKGREGDPQHHVPSIGA